MREDRYTSSSKLAINKLYELAIKFSTQTFEEAVLPYPHELQLKEQMSSLSDPQLSALLVCVMHEFECRVLGEHIANANKKEKRMRLEQIKDLIKGR